MIVYGALCPHPPLMVPAIGKRDLEKVQETIQGMRQLGREIADSRPDTLVFITPHGNVFQDAISVLAQPELKGDLGNFGHPEIKFAHANDLSLLSMLVKKVKNTGIDMVLVEESRYRLNPYLDHGITAPLFYLEEAGLKDTPLLALSYGLIPRVDLYRFGMLIQEAAGDLGRRVAVIASGDMSHRLKDDGPYGFNPAGPEFDRQIKELLEKGDFLNILELPDRLCEEAGECGYRSVLMLLGALNGLKVEPRIFSYEGPFGVGYLVAGFAIAEGQGQDLYHILREKREQEKKERREKESPLVRWARQCLEDYVLRGVRTPIPQELPEELKERAAVFVSLKKNGHLRGCIGTLQPVRENIALEIRENAISAGTQDPRFIPVEPHELDELVYSVDVLGEPEPITSLADLDPKRYGVIVRSGSRSGVLLPDLEGIDTPEQQVEIACQKAGIRKGEKFSMERFEVRRYY